MHNITGDIGLLPVMEQFYTIQGEGIHQGRAAYFIRLGGCDVGCVWCDVKESWDAAMHAQKSVAEIIAMVQEATTNGLVVITGGEPLMHPLQELTEHLKAMGYETSIETSGSHPLSGTWDNICLSPKKFKAPLPEILHKADELKIVIYNKSDFEWAATYADLVSDKCHLFLQPEWSKKDVMIPLITDYVMSHPKWQLSLQIHKYINMP